VNEVMEGLTRIFQAMEQARERERLLTNAPERYTRCVDYVGPGPLDETCFMCMADFAATEATVMRVVRIAGVRCNRVWYKACLDQWWAACTGRFAWRDATCPSCRGVFCARDLDAEVGINPDEILE
jgi:hypothetical protein